MDKKRNSSSSKATTSSVNHSEGSLWHGHERAPNGIGSLLFIHVVTADRIIRIGLVYATCLDSAKCWKTNTMILHSRIDNYPKHAVEEIQDLLKAKKWNILQWPSQSPDMSPTFH